MRSSIIWKNKWLKQWLTKWVSVAFKWRPTSNTQMSVKLFSYDGESCLQVYKIQFLILVEAKGRDSTDKAYHLAASLRGEAVDILHTLSNEERHSFDVLTNALELSFREKCLRAFNRLHLNFRLQKAGKTYRNWLQTSNESPQLFKWHSKQCSSTVIYLLDLESKTALRLKDIKDLNSTLDTL